MDKNEQKQIIEDFLDNVICKELEKLQNAQLNYMNFVLMGQSIEVLGALLDNKPMKSKGQSMKRFDNSVKFLFGGNYRLRNTNNYLYDKLRNQMTHTFIPSKDLIFLPTSSQNYKHLEIKGKKLVLIADVFYNDICKACERLKKLIREDKVKAKNIAFENE